MKAREDGTRDRLDSDEGIGAKWSCHPRVTFTGELEPGTCQVCGAMPTTGVVAWILDATRQIGMCAPCARAISRPVPFGKDARRGVKGARLVVKRFRPLAAEACRFGGRPILGEAVAVWRGPDCLVFCAACARGIARAAEA